MIPRDEQQAWFQRANYAEQHRESLYVTADELETLRSDFEERRRETEPIWKPVDPPTASEGVQYTLNGVPIVVDEGRAARQREAAEATYDYMRYGTSRPRDRDDD